MDPKVIGIVTLVLLVTTLAVTPNAAAQEPNCMPVYQEHHLGPVTIIQKDSCSARVVFNGLHPCDDWQPSIC